MSSGLQSGQSGAVLGIRQGEASRIWQGMGVGRIAALKSAAAGDAICYKANGVVPANSNASNGNRSWNSASRTATRALDAKRDMRTKESVGPRSRAVGLFGSIYTEFSLSSTLIQAVYGTVVLSGSGDFRQRILRAPPLHLLGPR